MVEKPRHRSGYGLRRDFDAIDSLGPARAARFGTAEGASQPELDDAAADAHGFVDDLLRAVD